MTTSGASDNQKEPSFTIALQASQRTITRMITASFGMTETGSVREENQDAYLLDTRHGLFAVADGLGGLPNGSRASRQTLEILHGKLLRAKRQPLSNLISEVNQEVRTIGFELDQDGFGTTLTLVRFNPQSHLLEIAHVGDSAAYLVKDQKVSLVTSEHTVAARMVADRFTDANEQIPAAAHHTLTQCIGQELYIDPEIIEVPVSEGDRVFLFTDGVTKFITEPQLRQSLLLQDSLERICQAITFRVEIAGSPDNYTVVAAQF